MKSINRVLVVCSLIVVFLVSSAAAFAKDAAVVTIPAGGAPDAMGIDANGNPLSAGTYAIGTLKLLYSNVDTMWIPGEFTNFTLHIATQQGHDKLATSYPANVYFRQSGRGLVLEVTDCTSTTGATFNINNSVLILPNSAATADCNVKVSIPQVDESLNFDGSVLVGNLQLETDPRTHLDTVTSVQVRTMLVFPEATCLRLFNVITNNGVDAVVTDFGIGAWYGSPSPSHPDGQIKTPTNPSEPADLVYVVNTCGFSEDVYVKIDLESHFATDPPNNMGFYTSATFDENSSIPTDWGDFSSSSNATIADPACLHLVIAANSSVAYKDKMELASTMTSQLPGYTSDGTTWTGTFQSFLSGVYTNNTCTTLSTESSPQSIALDLDFTVTY
jgi:hypothetical protein